MSATAGPEPNPVVILDDPLREVTRKARRSLLVASVAGILVVSAGVVPQEIAALGVTLSAPDQRNVLWVLIGIITYFIFAFVLYGWTDWLVWRKKWHDFQNEVAVASASLTIGDYELAQHDQLVYGIRDAGWLYRGAPPAARLRCAFDFVVPLVVALVSVVLLACHADWCEPTSEETSTSLGVVAHPD